MSTLNDIPPELRNHHQFPQATCAVSAFECVAKLHELLAPDKFPLQSDETNREKGFDDTSYLKSLGLSCEDHHYDTQSATTLIEKETNEGRFPLVSLREWKADGTILDYHIFLCALYNSKLLLVNPREPRIEAEKKEDLEKVLEYNSKNNPDRTTLHILHYQKK